MPISFNAYMKKWLKKRKAEGLCQRCGQPHDSGKCYCDACRKLMKDRQIERTINNQCVVCGMPTNDGMRMCEYHLEQKRLYQKTRRWERASKVLECKPIADKMLSELAAPGVTPVLIIVHVGEDPASEVYVRNKVRAAKKCGIHAEVIRLPADISADDFRARVENDISFYAPDGVIIQMPLPEHLCKTAEAIINKLSWRCDVDGLGLKNKAVWDNPNKGQKPCTAIGIMKILEHYDIPVDGKNVVIVGRSELVGKPLANMLTAANATVTLCHSHTANLNSLTLHADILISAVGKPDFIKPEMVSKRCVLIDVGINRTESGIVGDCSEEAREKVRAYTPVPGGVGQMTTAMLMYNVVKSNRGETNVG